MLRKRRSELAKTILVKPLFNCRNLSSQLEFIPNTHPLSMGLVKKEKKEKGEERMRNKRVQIESKVYLFHAAS